MKFTFLTEIKSVKFGLSRPSAGIPFKHNDCCNENDSFQCCEIRLHQSASHQSLSLISYKLFISPVDYIPTQETPRHATDGCCYNSQDSSYLHLFIFCFSFHIYFIALAPIFILLPQLRFLFYCFSSHIYYTALAPYLFHCFSSHIYFIALAPILFY